ASDGDRAAVGSDPDTVEISVRQRVGVVAPLAGGVAAKLHAGEADDEEVAVASVGDAAEAGGNAGRVGRAPRRAVVVEQRRRRPAHRPDVVFRPAGDGEQPRVRGRCLPRPGCAVVYVNPASTADDDYVVE